MMVVMVMMTMMTIMAIMVMMTVWLVASKWKNAPDSLLAFKRR